MPEPDEQDEPLREEDVTRGDRLDDRVAEGDGLEPERDVEDVED
jgi:hypothetical protein